MSATQKTPWRRLRGAAGVRFTVTVLALTAAASTTASCAPGLNVRGLGQSTPTSTWASMSPGSGERGAAAQLLSRLRVIEALPDVPGYDRSCQTEKGVKHACVFGPAWSDDTTAPDGHNGCDSRTDSIAAAAREVRRSGRCKIASGVLDDPYTGRAVPFTAATIAVVQIDHLISLHRAWQLGAAAWPLDRRAAFANDVDLELVVTTSINQVKGDRGIGEWQPPNAGYRCEYATKYATVSIAYDLPVTRADWDALTATLSVC